jgi:hypothetical protein
MKSGTKNLPKFVLYYSATATLAAGASVVPTADRILIGIIGTGVDFGNTVIETSIDGGTTWRLMEDTAGNEWDGKTQTEWTVFQQMLPCDGVNVRIRNTGAGDVTAFQYLYFEIEV